MAYRTFETRKANYVLQLQNHMEGYRSGTSLELFKDIDGLVVENTSDSLVDVINHADSDYRGFIDQAKDKRIPVYGVDVSLEGIPADSSAKRKIKRQLFGMIPEVLPALMFWNYVQEPREMSDSVQRIWSTISFLGQSPGGEGRNSLNAEKIEEFVVDRVAAYSGKSKPKIGLVYGAAHTGLEADLKSRIRRKATQFNWKHLNIGKWRGFDRETLSKIYEATFNPENKIWEVQEFCPDLF